MNEDHFSGGRSSLFVNGKALALFGGGSVVSAVFDLPALSAVLAFLFFFCLASRLWGESALHRVRAEVRSMPGGLFPQGTAEVEVRIKNEKWIPVIWLEVLRPLAQKDALVPLEEKILEEDQRQLLQRKFTFLMGQEELIWTSRWEARRRGLFRPERMYLQAGDGFGLTQARRSIDGGSGAVAVYPALQDVSAEFFLRDIWDCSGGGNGYLEDPTVIQSTRDYQLTDSFKRINWRLTARTQQTVVNTYETILPKSAHFIVDCESFNGIAAEEEAFEDTLSILTSLLVQLRQAGMRFGVSMPQGRWSNAAEFPGGTPLEEILHAFSAYELCALIRPEDPHEPYYALPSVFREEELLRQESVGRFYYVCFSLDKAKKQRLFRRLDSSRTVLLPYAQITGKDREMLREFTVLTLTALKRRNDHDP